MPKNSKSKKSGPRSTEVKGWFISGANPDMYQVSLDTSDPHSGTRCALLQPGPKVKDKKLWSTLMQCMGPEQFRGRRLRFTMWVKTKNADSVQPWMRIDGPEQGVSLAFDNMCKRNITGTTKWNEYSIVLDVPLDSTNICFGVILMGSGYMWLDDVSLEAVSKRVPVTDCPCSRNSKDGKRPMNLNFEEE